MRPEPEHGTNVELVRPMGPGHIAMRVHERGVGETRSCGTGACAAAIATSFWAGGLDTGATWLVDVPGGRLTVRLLPDHGVELAGPAVLVADGVVDLALLPGLTDRRVTPSGGPHVAADELDEALEVRLVLGRLEHHARGADPAEAAHGIRHGSRVAGHAAAGCAVGAVPAGAARRRAAARRPGPVAAMRWVTTGIRRGVRTGPRPSRLAPRRPSRRARRREVDRPDAGCRRPPARRARGCAGPVPPTSSGVPGSGGQSRRTWSRVT